MINEVLLEHQTPFLDDVEQRLAERPRVDAEPLLKGDAAFDRLDVLVYRLVRVDLQRAAKECNTSHDVKLQEDGIRARDGPNAVARIWNPTTDMQQWASIPTRGQSNLTKSASRGAHFPVRDHPRGSKFVPLNSWGRVSY